MTVVPKISDLFFLLLYKVVCSFRIDVGANSKQLFVPLKATSFKVGGKC